jgi:hypothetical protein
MSLTSYIAVVFNGASGFGGVTMDNKTPAEVEIRLLGCRKLARALGVTPGAVSKWQESGLVPSKYHKSILAFAKLQRKRLTPEMLTYGA